MTGISIRELQGITPVEWSDLDNIVQQKSRLRRLKPSPRKELRVMKPKPFAIVISPRQSEESEDVIPPTRRTRGRRLLNSVSPIRTPGSLSWFAAQRNSPNDTPKTKRQITRPSSTAVQVDSNSRSVSPDPIITQVITTPSKRARSPILPHSDDVLQLESEIASLKDQLEKAYSENDRLVSRLAKAECLDPKAAPLRDDAYFERQIHHLHLMIRNFVSQFLYPCKKVYPRKFPTKLKDLLNREREDWEEHLANSTSSRKQAFRSAMAHKYIAFYLTGKLIIPALPFDDSDLSDVFEKFSSFIIRDPQTCSQWRSSTLNSLLKSSNKAFSMDRIVKRLTDELWVNSKMLWHRKEKPLQLSRLRKITEHAFLLGAELGRLPNDIKCVLGWDDNESISKRTNGEPTRVPSTSELPSRSTEIGRMVIFPGIYKAMAENGCGTGRDEIAVEYHPVESITY